MCDHTETPVALDPATAHYCLNNRLCASKERTHGTLSVEGWLGPLFDLEALEKEVSLYLCRGSDKD